jgi:hypothetical protein
MENHGLGAAPRVECRREESCRRRWSHPLSLVLGVFPASWATHG